LIAMTRLHLILFAALDTARGGGLSRRDAEAIFDALSEYLDDVPGDCVTTFEENVRRILDADLP
jgi:hypothetical protein